MVTRKRMQGERYTQIYKGGMHICPSVTCDAAREEGNGLVLATCVPFSVPCAMGDGGAVCDPKGAGVLTTRTRYSRKEYRQTHVFAPPGTYHPKK